MKSRRKNDRDLCADLLKIRWEDEVGRKHRGVATLEDISPGGVCLQMEHPITPQTVLTILYPSGTYRGKVKYCVYQDKGYFLGVEFEPGFRWSPRLYKPAHLLRLRRRQDKS